MREKIGLVKADNGKFGERLQLTLEPSGRMLSLNKTSVRNLINDFGDDDGKWKDKEIEVYAGKVEMQGGRQADAVLVKAAKSAQPAPKANTKGDEPLQMEEPPNIPDDELERMAKEAAEHGDDQEIPF